MSDLAAVLLGLGAALVLGIASVADQRSTKRVRKHGALSPRIFSDLARQPLWVASIGGTVAGFALQVAALRFGPLAVVEPLLICDLIFAVMISSYLGDRIDPLLFAGVLATAAGVVGFLVIARPTTGRSSVGFYVVLPLAAGLTAAVLGCLAIGHRSPRLRPLATALACGICYGVSAFLIKMVVSDGTGGIGHILTDWPIYALAVIGPLGFLLNQNAFQQDVLIAPVMSIITVCDPIISIALAAVWLDERLTSTPAAVAGQVISLLVMTAGIVVITHQAPHLSGPKEPAAGK